MINTCSEGSLHCVTSENFEHLKYFRNVNCVVTKQLILKQRTGHKPTYLVTTGACMVQSNDIGHYCKTHLPNKLF